MDGKGRYLDNIFQMAEHQVRCELELAIPAKV